MTMDRPPIHPLVAHCMSAYDIPESALAHDGGVAMTVDAVYSLRPAGAGMAGREEPRVSLARRATTGMT